jgi:DNA repair protein RadD
VIFYKLKKIEGKMKNVISTSFYLKESKKGDMMLVVEHACEGTKFPDREYVLLNHQGFARTKAEAWWKERAMGEPPASAQEAMTRLEDIRPIKQLNQEKKNDFWEVTEVVFGSPNNIKQTSFEDDDIAF